MALWLLKTEPDDYAYDDLVRDKACVWDGVANALALKHIRAIQKGDRVFVYHTGKEKAVVGIATVTKSAYADPKADDPKLSVVDLKPAKKLKRPVTLGQMKADKAFEGWDLLRIGRLSAMPVPTALWDRIEHLSEKIDD
ncbi:MAG TPA: EVE domain-containing protein [Tepidisphaeraceae bacterium]|jgi:predicted RNA-binding protein with PUA-like domain